MLSLIEYMLRNGCTEQDPLAPKSVLRYVMDKDHVLRSGVLFPNKETVRPGRVKPFI